MLPEQEILEKYNNGMDGKQLSKIYNVSTYIIYKLLKDNNVKIRGVKSGIANQHNKWKGYGEVGSSFISNMKYNAKKAKINFNVDCKYIWNLYLQQNKKCKYSNQDIKFSDKNVSFLRKDKNKGYEINNIVLVHINVSKIMKWFCLEQVLYWSNLIVNPEIKNNQIVIYKKEHNRKRLGCNNITGKYWCHLIKCAKKRNIEFKITPEYAWSQYEKQNGCCNLTGKPIIFGKNYKEWHQVTTCSLDRIDSSKGYIEGNVQWLHTDINKMKYDLDIHLFINICNLIYNNYKGVN